MYNAFEVILGITLILFSGAVTCFTGGYALAVRRSTAIVALAAISFTQTLWIVFYAAELASPDLQRKLLWDSAQWIPAFVLPPMLVLFITYYFRPDIRWPLWARIGGITVTVSLILSATLPPMNQLAYNNVRLENAPPFNRLSYEFGPLVVIGFVYNYLLLIANLAFMLTLLRNDHRLYRAQFLLLIAAILVPALGIWIPFITEVHFLGQRDISPLLFTLMNMIIAVAVFRFKLTDIMPLARNMVFDSMEDAVVVVDMRNRVLDLNRVARASADPALKQLIGLPLETVFPGWAHQTKLYKHVLHARHELDEVINGVRRTVLIIIAPVEDRRGNVLGRIIVVRNIRAEVGLRESLQQRVHDLEQMRQKEAALAGERERRQVLEDFIQGASHDLRTPITTLHTSNYIIQRRLALLRAALSTVQAVEAQALSKHVDEIIERTEMYQTSLDHLGSLVEAMFDAVRLDNLEQLDLMPVNLNDLIAACIYNYQPSAEQQNIRLKLTLNEPVTMVAAHAAQLSRVLDNLIQNALRYTPPGGHIGVILYQKGSQACIEVSDTGVGIRAEDLPHIFKRFYRTDSARRTQTGGAGLGLTIARRIVELHGGEITVSSQVGVGSTFKVSLPILQDVQ